MIEYTVNIPPFALKAESKLTMSKSYDAIKLLGTLAIERGWASQEDVQYAITKQGADKFFGEILLSKKLITVKQLDELLQLQQKLDIKNQDFLFGELAIQNQFIKAEEVISCLEDQKKSNIKKSLGSIFLEKGLLNQQQCDAILTSQKRIQKTVQIKNKRVSCPKCKASFPVNDSERYRKVRCKSCQFIFGIGSPDIKIVVDAGHKNTIEATEKEFEKSLVQFLKENKLKPRTSLSGGSNFISKDDERYIVGDEIARGGMGAILLTRDVNLKRNIVTKVLLNNRSRIATLRFIEEAQITGQLEHPNIPPVYDLGLNKENNLFFTMKQIKGETLQHVINDLKANNLKTKERYPYNSLVNIFIKVCNALEFAHSKNVIHRDIKPENIMVGEYGEVLLMDWGLAKIIGSTEELEELEGEKITSIRTEDVTSNTMEGTTAGTPAFMSPEQATGHMEKLDQRSDIYSLGATIFNVLALERAFKGSSIYELLQNVADGKMQELKGDVPPELKAITLKAMEFEPKYRYQSIKEMEKDLLNYQMGYAVSAKQDNAFDTIKKFYKRNQLLSIISTCFIIIFIVGSIYFVTSLSSQKNIAINQKEIALEQTKIANDALVKAELAIKQFEKEKKDRLADNKESAPSLYAKAQFEAQVLNMAEAEKLMDTAIGYDSANQTYRLYRGCLALTNSNIKKAIEDLTTIKNSPNQKNIIEILKILKSSNQTELDEKQKIIIAEICTDLKLFDIAQKLTTDFAKKIELWNKLLTEVWGKKEFRLGLGKGEENVSLKLCFEANNLPENTDFSLLKGMPIKIFRLQSCKFSNLSFMENMPIEELVISNCPLLSDISSLKNIKLKVVSFDKVNVSDISSIANPELKILILKNMPVTSLTALTKIDLAGIELENIKLQNFNDLTSFYPRKIALANCNINDLECINTKNLCILKIKNARIKDLTKLKNAELLDSLDISNTLVTNISPIQDKNLRVLNLMGCYIQNIETILTLKKLEALIITPTTLPPDWVLTVSKMKEQIKQIGTEMAANKVTNVANFLEEFKNINKNTLTNPIK